MSPLILRTASDLLRPLLLLFSIFLLLRGHQEPGGGFVGGLIAACAYVLHAIAYDVAGARRALSIDPKTLTGTGLAVALSSALLSVTLGKDLMTGVWGKAELPFFGPLELGTPMIFDVGVYLVVMGTVLTVFLELRGD
ncbi:MAG: Na(+)/H(+) antiporter subunit B [Candidatus Omnitrophica bacterium]|nr:Na(+)/H(+) antiporter subunit B [Candidatus Omnitrophota bacterium]